MASDQRERYDDTDEALRMGLDAHQSKMWTSMPGIVEEHDREKNTIHVKIPVKLKHVKADGTVEWKEIPVVKDVPLQYTGGGGVSITPPIKKGDEVLMSFTSRSFDNWWKNGGVQEQNEFRMHDVNDGFAIPGFRSQPRRLKNVSEKTWQLRTDEENPSQFVDFDPENKTFKVKSPNPVTIDAPELRCTGKIVAGYGTGDQVGLQSHTHAQPEDTGGDTEAETDKPTAGT